MQNFSNLKTGTKLTCAFLAMAAIILIVAALGHFSLKALNGKVALTPEERQWLSLHNGQIRIGVTVIPPQVLSGNGKYKGISIDYIHLMERKLGCRFELVSYATWSEVVHAARVRQIDMIFAAQQTPERLTYLLFTEPYIELPNMILVRKDRQGGSQLKEMKGWSVATSEGSAVHEYLKKEFGYLVLRPVPDELNGLMKVSMGEVDAMVVEVSRASYYIEKAGILNLRVAGEAGLLYQLRFAVRNDWPILRGILDKGLSAVTDIEREEINHRWIIIGERSIFASRAFWISFAAALGIITLMIAGVIMWNRTLRRIVRQRTLRLQQELTDRKRAEEALRLNAERMDTLLQLNQMTDTTRNEITSFAFEAAVRLTRSKLGYLAFLNEDETVLTMQLWSHSAMAECAIADKPIIYPVETTGLWGEAVRQRRPIITNDYAAANPWKKGTPEGHVQLTRHMNLPVIVVGRIVLVAGVGNKTEDYDETDVQQLTLLMEGMWRLIERKQTEHDRLTNLHYLQESEERYRLVIENTEHSITIFDLNLKPTEYIAPSILKRRGYTAQEALTQTLDQMMTPESLQLASKMFAGQMALESSPTADPARTILMELEEYCKDGSTIWVEIVASFIRDNNFKPTGILTVARDITERKRAEEEIRILNAELEQRVANRTSRLEAANRELEAFSYSVSHDLRAPLRTINGFGKMLLNDCEDKLDINGKDYLHRIIAAAGNMALLIEDMLKLSKITRTEMNIAEINLTGIAQSVIDELRKSEPKRNINIKIAEGLKDKADARLMRIALENLLDNAWKFTGKQANAVIEFGSTKEGETMVYFVYDNGAGFDMAYLNKLFAPFQRLHTMEEYPGTGIGLAIVKRIITLHGGKVWAEGNVGGGATFYFSLPQSPEKAGAL